MLRYFTASDHLYVLHVLAMSSVARRPPDSWSPYSIKDLDPVAVVERFRELRDALPAPFEDVPPTPVLDELCADKIQRILETVCAESLAKKRLPRGARTSNYWWTEEIAEARRAMHKARRAFQRKRKWGDPRLEDLRRTYSLARRQVQVLIWRSKEGFWRGLLSTVDGDPWGKPYKIVMARLRGKAPRTVMSADQVSAVVGSLFVTSAMPYTAAAVPAAMPSTSPRPRFLRPSTSTYAQIDLHQR